MKRGMIVGLVAIMLCALAGVASAQGGATASYVIGSTVFEGVNGSKLTVKANSLMINGDFMLTPQFGLGIAYYGFSDVKSEENADATLGLSYFSVDGLYRFYSDPAVTLYPLVGYANLTSSLADSTGSATVSLSGFKVGIKAETALAKGITGQMSIGYYPSLSTKTETKAAKIAVVPVPAEPEQTASAVEFLGSVAYEVAPQINISAGYRYLSAIGPSNDDWKLSNSGPFVGVGYRF
ncbi:MAG: outer membrane beta-barrel protein [Firmicutes bacterium]|nr:outer membrane beta-barrel protein [Bacillota bacterium]